jgi:hypothetical protein
LVEGVVLEYDDNNVIRSRQALVGSTGGLGLANENTRG